MTEKAKDKVTLEAKRALRNIESYGLEVYALTVDLGLVQDLGDLEEGETKKDKKPAPNPTLAKKQKEQEKGKGNNKGKDKGKDAVSSSDADPNPDVGAKGENITTQSGDQPIADNATSTVTSTPVAQADPLLACINLIRMSKPDCSVLLITESTGTGSPKANADANADANAEACHRVKEGPAEDAAFLRVMAYSCNAKLDPTEWMMHATGLAQGFPGTPEVIEEKVVSQINVIMDKKKSATTIKEKENVLAGAFAYLRLKGLLKEESDDEMALGDLAII